MHLRLLLQLCMLIPLLLWQGNALACQVCVVSSVKTQAFQDTFDSLGQEMGRIGLQRNSLSLLSVQEFQEGSGGLQNARLLVTLGTDALRQVSQRNTRLPVLAALVPRQSFERILSETGRRNAGGVSALFLDQPLARQLELLRLALPQARRVGVLWGPESLAQQAAVSNALHTRGLELRESTFGDGQNLSGALQSVLQDADVLLQVADALVYNTATVSNVLLTSYRAKVPVLAFSPAYVKAGALLSVHSTASQVGVQLAAMAAQVVQGNGVPPAQYPNDFTITVNDYVARSLGLKLDAGVLTDTLQRGERRP